MVNVATTCELTRRWSLIARIDNLLDRHFQNPVGFSSRASASTGDQGDAGNDRPGQPPKLSGERGGMLASP